MDTNMGGDIHSFALGTTREQALEVVEKKQNEKDESFFVSTNTGLDMGNNNLLGSNFVSNGNCFDDIADPVVMQSIDDNNNDIDPEEKQRSLQRQKDHEQYVERLQQMEKQEQEAKEARKASARQWLNDWNSSLEKETEQRRKKNRQNEKEQDASNSNKKTTNPYQYIAELIETRDSSVSGKDVSRMREVILSRRDDNVMLV